jgi:3-phytase
MRRLGVLVVTCLLSYGAWAQTPSVPPAAQTEPADAGPLLPVVWVSPADAGADRVFATDGEGNLYTYRTDGTFVSLTAGGFGAAAIVYSLPLSGVATDLLAVTSRTEKSLSLIPIAPGSGALGPPSTVTGVLTGTAADLARVAAYRSPVDGAHYLFVADATGNVEQWRVFDDGSGKATAERVERTLALGEGLGGLIADDGRRRIYLTGQSTGLWRFDAEPDGGDLLAVDSTSGGLDLIAPLGGVAIYRAPDAGYLVAASGDGAFAVYRGGASSSADYLTRFRIGTDGGLDGVQGTVGLALESFRVGAAGQGLLVAHDALLEDGGTNLKLVPWASVADAGGLRADGGVDPHGLPDAGADGGTDAGVDGGTDGGPATGGSAGGGLPAGGPGATPTSTGCGCSGGAATLGGLGYLALLALVRRRRRPR